jgi:uncharacterized protein (DUF1499 family)
MLIKILYGLAILLGLLLVLFCIMLFILARQSASLNNAGLLNDQLQACPDEPRCVSSQTSSAQHSIAAFEVPSGLPDPVGEMAAIILDIPRTEIISQSESYLHATFQSKVFGFVDDLEILKDGEGLQVRSVSRVGRSDLGANRKRVEAIHEIWRQTILQSQN